MKLYLYKIKNSYLLKDGDGGDYLIDGKLVKNFYEGWLSGKPKSIKRIVKKKRTVNYGGLSPEEYKRRVEELLSKAIGFDEYDEPIWGNLDDEYAYKKFVYDHPPKEEEYVDYEDCEIVEYDITGRTDIKWIQPFRYLGKEPVNDEGKVLYRYKANPYEMAQEIAKKLGFKEVEDGDVENTVGRKWSVPKSGRDTLRFLQINGKYADYESLPCFCSVVGTWEECYKKYVEHYTAIEKLFKQVEKEIEAVGKPVDKATVIDFLQILKKFLQDMKVKANSKVYPYTLIKRIDDFIEKL